MTYTKWLNDTNIEEIALVGGKNASLGEMIQNLTSIGVMIPYGFVITSDAYDKFMEDNKLNKQIQSILDNINVNDTVGLKKNSLIIKKLIQNGDFDPQMTVEILNKYSELSNMYKNNDNPDRVYTDIAVRSSATCEDLPDASFAGQQDTYLNVVGNSQLLEKIKSCFASLFNDRAICYRKSMNYDNSQSIKLSVCVQKMVRSDLATSGVAFSLDPDSGFKDVVIINGSYGLGEMVVGGQVRADEFVVFKPTLFEHSLSSVENSSLSVKGSFKPIIDKKLGNKEHKMIYHTDSDKRTKIIPVENSKKNKFCMDEEKILLLARWVCEIEKYYSKLKGKWCPMDVEWAVDGLTDQLYIVQARPETIFSRRTDSFELIEYKIKDGQNKKILCNGIAVGDKIATGKVRIMLNLDDKENISFENGDILVTENTDPDWEPIMRKASAIISNKGSRVSHTAIICREMGIPALVGCGNATQILQNNKEITLDCSNGEIGFVYENLLKYDVIKTNIKDLPQIKTKIMLNVATPDQAFQFCKLINNGVGLAREEFIINNFIQVHPNAILNYDKMDTDIKLQIDRLTSGFDNPIDYYIKKLSYGIGRIGAAFYPKDTIVRFSDFKSNEYANLLGGKNFEPHEENPMLGFRGCNRYYSPQFEQAFAMECKAIKFVRDVMGLKNVIVMLPFCRTVTECQKVLAIMEKHGLKRGVDGLQVYLMCEIPSNVILADQFLQYVDGYSIGSNDLTQTTLGLDRDSTLVAHLFDERDEAVKIMISTAIKACKRNGKKIGICGNGPSSLPDFCSFLVREGIDSISLTCDVVLKTLMHIKNIEDQIDKENNST